MALETEVISCPACKHPLRVPLDWLGQDVQCPQCKSMFKAPVKADGKLTEPKPLNRTPPVEIARKKNLDAMLLLPAFGLMLCGVVGMFVNGAILFKLLFDRDGGREWAKEQVRYLQPLGIGGDGPPATKEQRIEQSAEQLLKFYRWVYPLSLLVCVGVFLGGLSIALRWNFRIAQFGCVLAMINISNACCIPGVVAGLWGLLMLNSEEGRGHFGK